MRRRWRLLAVALGTALILVACGGDDTTDTTNADQPDAAAAATSTPAPEPTTDEPATEAPTAEEPAAEEPTAEEPTAEEPAPEEAADAPSDEVAASAEPRAVQFTTPDGEVLAGAVFGEGDVGIVLAHMRGRDKTTWYAFARNAAQAGYRALAFDFRGYGESTGERDTDLDVDLIAAVEYLRSEGITSTVVMGASMGATATVNVASRLELAAAVSLSAPGEFLGLPAIDVADDISEPLLLVVAENDQPYADAAVEIDARAPITQLQMFAGNAHGTNLFAEYDTQLTMLLLDFVSARAG